MKRIFLVILSVVMIFSSCDTVDFGDTNKNVNGPADANTASLLSGAMTNFATRRGRPYRITPTLNVQYFMQLVYNDEMLYANTPGYWRSYYVQTTSNCQAVIDICSVEGADVDVNLMANGDVINQLAVATIFKQVIMKRTTDLFGDIPYSNALTTETLTPEYDTQEQIYRAMIDEVKAARDIINTSPTFNLTGDALFNGNMTQWVKFANSFIMSLAIQISEAGSSTIDAAAEFSGALAHPGGVIETLDEEAWYTFDPDNGFKNPWEWMRPADYGVTQEMISSMRGAGDNKVTSNTTFDDRILFVLADTAPSVVGLPYGYMVYSEIHADVNSALISAGTPLPVLTAAYTYLNRAEAASRGWTTEDAATMLTAGIQASYASMDALYDTDGSVDIGDGAAYAAARVADMGTAAELQVIGEEKWIALYPLGYDAWAEQRRSGWPNLLPAPDALNGGALPCRYNYPSEEVSLNPTNYAIGVSGLNPADDDNKSHVWWDK